MHLVKVFIEVHCVSFVFPNHVFDIQFLYTPFMSLCDMNNVSNYPEEALSIFPLLKLKWNHVYVCSIW